MPMVSLPQFIEREARIAGPLTFKQFISLLVVGGISLFVYLLLPPPFSRILTIIILLLGIALVFVKVEGLPLYTLLGRRFVFLFSSKTLLWGKGKFKSLPVEEVEIKKIEKDKIKMKRGGSFENLITKIETKK